MRSILSGLLVVSAASASTVGMGCLQNEFELVIRTSCGDDGSISKCLATIVNLERLDEIEQCYIAGGCDTDDARLGAGWFAEACNEYEKPELKKRASTETSEGGTTTEKAIGKTTAESDAQTAAATTAKTSAETTEKSTTEGPSTTEASTTQSITTAKSTTASTTSESTSSSTTTDSTTSTSSTTSVSSTSSTSRSSTSTNSGTITGTLLCSSTNIVTTKVCSVYTAGKSDGQTIGCTSTTTPLATCAAGNICSTDTDGQSVCMKKDDSLTTSGVIVTIVFGSGIAAFSIALIYMKILEHQANKKRAAARGAAMLAGAGNGKGKGRAEDETAGAHAAMQSEANLPLITQTDTHNDQFNYQNYPQNPDEYFQGSSSRSPSPYDPTRGSSAPPPPPKLHPGLGALS